MILKRLLFVSLALAGFISCSKDDSFGDSTPAKQRFNISLGDQTKVSFASQAGSASGSVVVKTCWEHDDIISIYKAQSGDLLGQFIAIAVDESTGEATFELLSGESLDTAKTEYVAVYPSSSASTLSERYATRTPAECQNFDPVVKSFEEYDHLESGLRMKSQPFKYQDNSTTFVMEHERAILSVSYYTPGWKSNYNGYLVALEAFFTTETNGVLDTLSTNVVVTQQLGQGSSSSLRTANMLVDEVLLSDYPNGVTLNLVGYHSTGGAYKKEYKLEKDITAGGHYKFSVGSFPVVVSDVTQGVDTLAGYWIEAVGAKKKAINVPKDENFIFVRDESTKWAVSKGLYEFMSTVIKGQNRSNVHLTVHTLAVDNAFENCTSLKTLTLTNASSDTGDNGFANCSNLEEVYLQKITRLPQNVFKGCPKLKKIAVYHTAPSDISVSTSIFGSQNDASNPKSEDVVLVLNSSTASSSNRFTASKTIESGATATYDFKAIYNKW